MSKRRPSVVLAHPSRMRTCASHPPRPAYAAMPRALSRFANREPPDELAAAAAGGPIPLIWAFPRARRARPLPPAYVLMYHSERKIPLDRTFLQSSLEQRCYPKRLAEILEQRKAKSLLLEQKKAASKDKAVKEGSHETVRSSASKDKAVKEGSHETVRCSAAVEDVTRSPAVEAIAHSPDAAEAKSVARCAPRSAASCA